MNPDLSHMLFQLYGFVLHISYVGRIDSEKRNQFLTALSHFIQKEDLTTTEALNEIASALERMQTHQDAYDLLRLMEVKFPHIKFS